MSGLTTISFCSCGVSGVVVRLLVLQSGGCGLEPRKCKAFYTNFALFTPVGIGTRLWTVKDLVSLLVLERL